MTHESITAISKLLWRNVCLTHTYTANPYHSYTHLQYIYTHTHLSFPIPVACRLEVIDGQSIPSDRLTLSPWQPPLSPLSWAIHYKSY